MLHIRAPALYSNSPDLASNRFSPPPRAPPLLHHHRGFYFVVLYSDISPPRLRLSSLGAPLPLWPAMQKRTGGSKIVTAHHRHTCEPDGIRIVYWNTHTLKAEALFRPHCAHVLFPIRTHCSLLLWWICAARAAPRIFRLSSASAVMRRSPQWHYRTNIWRTTSCSECASCRESYLSNVQLKAPRAG